MAPIHPEKDYLDVITIIASFLIIGPLIYALIDAFLAHDITGLNVYGAFVFTGCLMLIYTSYKKMRKKLHITA